MSNFFSALGDIFTNESMYRNTMIVAVVLMFAASGELVAEKAGTINISLEGMMLAGAYAAAVGQARGGAWGGLAMAALAGLLVAAIQANMSHRLSADQFVVGLVLNVLVLGIVGFLVGSNEPESHVVKRFEIPGLSKIPLIGPALFDAPWVLYVVYPVVPAIWFLLYRTRWGLEVRAIGEDPNASDVSGLSVNKLRRQTIYLTGMLAGVGGGYFLYARSPLFEDSLIGGRGYIAIAAVIFGGWTLKGTVAGCVIFGLVSSFVLTIPGLGYKAIDTAFLAMAPNLVTIVVMLLFAKRVRQPAALARPFLRGLK